MTTVRIDDHLRVRKADLPSGHEVAIKQRLTIPNGARLAAIKRNQWGAFDMPETIPLYRDEDLDLVMPRGFAAELRAGMEASGHTLYWDDHTSRPKLRVIVLQHPDLRDDQKEACRAIILHRQGVLQAPTGSGKTVTVLEAWRRACTPGLILVEKSGLAKQWRERAQEHLGIEAGTIGEGAWDERPLTIAIMQTLYRRDIPVAWWSKWGFTAGDECHHLVAETYASLIARVRSRWLIGVTATPLEGEWTQPLLTHTLGPIIHITTPESLRSRGVRVTPMIRRVPTGWRWVPNARDAQLVDTKVIYRRIIGALREDNARVLKIARTINAQPPECAQLVVSRELRYLNRLRDALEDLDYEGAIYMMRGSESGDRRAEISGLADAGGCVIFSTVADEGIDIPRLDRLHLTWPERKDRPLEQKIGRVLRTHLDKRGTIVFDYVDAEGMLISQANARLRFYRRSGYAVEQEQVHADA